MKVLFFMRHPGYVRNFESTLAELAERGHRVHVAFDRYYMPWQPDRNPIDPLCARYRDITHDASPVPAASVSGSVGTQLGVLTDYLRYFSNEYAQAPKLRARARKAVPAALRDPIDRLARNPSRRRSLGSALAAMERAVAVPDEVVDYIRGHAPDLVIVTPLVGLGSPQAQYLRAAKLDGRPTVLAVASWDNLTNKGLIRGAPDWVTVWNEAQRGEAVDLHGLEPGRVVATGAQSYDHWFSWPPSTTREEFCAMVGLDPARPYLLFVGSSPFIAQGEAEFVRRWATTLRASDEPEVRDVGILIRPHPQNGAQYLDADFSALDNVAVWPRGGADPVDRDAKSDYYDSIHHSVGVVGINTSALIESAIIGRRVHTLLTDDFAGTQAGTLHFAHIADDETGFVHVGRTFADHVVQLREAITSGPEPDQRSDAFVRRFVRPRGLDAPATPYVVDAFEAAAASQPGAPEPEAACCALRAAGRHLDRSPIPTFPAATPEGAPQAGAQPCIDALVRSGACATGWPGCGRRQAAPAVLRRASPVAGCSSSSTTPATCATSTARSRSSPSADTSCCSRSTGPRCRRRASRRLAGLGDRVRVVDRTPRRKDVWGARCPRPAGVR